MCINSLQLKLLKIERILKRLQKIWTNWSGTCNEVYVYQRVSEYREMWRSIAEVKGAKFSILADDFWEIEFNGVKTKINNYQLEFDNPVILRLAGDKPLIHRLLKEKNIPVPEHIVFKLAELDKAKAFLKMHPKGCVIKPARYTYTGQGVTTNIKSYNEVRKAAVLASLYCDDLLMEPHIPGECYRILVLGGKMVHAVCREGSRLQGDGLSTVLDLIKARNILLRSQNKNTLKIDRDCLFSLDWQNLSLHSIPEKGQQFLVKSINDALGRNAEVRTIYNKTVTNLICDSVKISAEQSAKILNSEFVGVDIITTDPSIPLEKSGGVIDELNTTPGLHHHYNVTNEKYPQPAVQALSMLLNRGKFT